MGPSQITRTIGILALLVLCGVSARAQRVRGELRLEVHDPHGAAVSPAGELVSEANGVLHPRGSEYDVQFVVDGLPLTQNRSPAFAPSFDAGDVESLRVVTASFPAEYGRKLGGIVEVTTKKDVPAGWHGRFDAGGGSFSTTNGAAGISYAQGANRFSASGEGFHTERYLDPPVLANYTNRGNAT